LLKFVRIECDDDRALVAAKRGRGRDAGEGRKQRAHLIQSDILQLALCVTVARKQEKTNGNTSRIETRDEGWNRTRRHEGASAIYITNRLSHCLLHIRSFAERQFHQSCALNTLAIHRLNACDVEEVILVVVGKKSFHLRGRHAAVGLGDVDHRIANLWKDVHAHPPNRNKESSDDRNQRDDHGERTTQSCEN